MIIIGSAKIYNNIMRQQNLLKFLKNAICMVHDIKKAKPETSPWRGGGWTRTTERIPGQIYSLLQLPLCDSPNILKNLAPFKALQKYIFFPYLRQNSTNFFATLRHQIQLRWNTISTRSSIALIPTALNTTCVSRSSATPMCCLCGWPIWTSSPEFTQTHTHRVSEAIQPSHPLSSPSPPAP